VRPNAKASLAGSTLGSGIRRGRIGLACLCVLGLAAFLGSSAPSAGAQACPNESFRQGPSANLPDCRAYEMATPVDMEGEEPATEWSEAESGPEAAANGGAVAFSAFGTFGEATSNSAVSAFLSRRGAGDWSTEQVSPPFSPSLNIAIVVAEAFTPNLDKTVSFAGVEPPLTPDASAGTSNLYLRDNASRTFRLVSVGLGEGLGYTEARTKGLSADASHVVFEQTDNYEMAGSNCAPPAKTILCDWNAATGAVSLIGISPGGAVLEDTPVALAGPEWARNVSADGSRIFFKGGGAGGAGECGICVRINGTTTQLISDEGTFWFASSDGSLAYITEGEDLMLYNTATDELSAPLAGEVQGVLGTSADGSAAYLVSKEALAPGATGGENNLYLWSQGGGFEFIATGNTSTAFTNNYRQNLNPTSRVTPDGMHLAFTANNSLTGYPHAGTPEVYLYSAATGELVCASCNPSGEPEPGGSGGSIEVGGGAPGPDAETRLRRNLSDDGGRLFFNTDEALVPRDTNGLQDVYEYDVASGQVALISTGTAGEEQPVDTTGFADASPSGDDVFFQTRQRLVGVAQAGVLNIYDARVGGGLASQNPPAPGAPCTGDACRSETAPIPTQPSGASAGFVGKGNLSQKQNCSKLGREAKKLSNRAKRLRKNAKTAKRNGKSGVARKRNKKATRLAKQARNKSKSAKKCRKRNRGASK
jgi:hypothetical protein